MFNATTTETIMCFRKGSPNYILLFLALVAAPSNLLIMRVLIVRFRLALPRHKILLCLSVSDALQIVGTGMILLIGQSLQPTVTSLSCQVLRQTIEVVTTQTHVASSGFIVLLAIERYIACIHSLRLYTIVTPSRANFAVVSVWLMSILCGLVVLHPNEPNFTKFVTSSNARYLWVTVTTSLVSVIILIIVQVRLYRLSRIKLKTVPHNVFGTQKEKHDLTRRQLKLGFAASVVIIMYIVCVLPLSLFYMYMLFNPKNKEALEVKGHLTSIALLNTFANTFVYGLGMADVRRGIKREFKYLKQHVCRN